MFSYLLCIYLNKTKNKRAKYELLGKKFEENFQEKPNFFTRAPGRVNLIGI